MSLFGEIFSAVTSLFSSKTDTPRAVAHGNWDTCGPAVDEHHPVTVMDNLKVSEGLQAKPDGYLVANGLSPDYGTFADGWWTGARRTPANSGRIGGLITPRGLVVHTTDTYPGGFNAIVKTWVGSRGKGNAAHFMIGRSEDDGVVQFVPVTHNGNHAGGPIHGSFNVPTNVPGRRAEVHPNLWTIGVELDNAGKLRRNAAGGVEHPDTNKPVAYKDVFWDADGRPWHAVTPYQMDQLQKLWLALEAVLAPMPITTSVKPDGDYRANQALWAATYRVDLVGHATLDPVNKTDPGPQVMSIIREWR